VIVAAVVLNKQTLLKTDLIDNSPDSLTLEGAAKPKDN
jgi:hypothetical protein